MNQEGHIGLSMLLMSPISLLLGLTGNYYLCLGFSICVFWMSTIPDIDIAISRSLLGKVVDIDHRGFTHTVYFGIICGLLASGIGSVIPSHSPILSISVMFLSGFLGVVFHIVGDVMTPTGVNYYPRSMESEYSLDWFNYNNVAANFGFLFLGFLAVSSSFVAIYDSLFEGVIILALICTLGLYVVVGVAKRTEFRYQRSVIGRLNSVTYWLKKLT